MKRAKCVTEKRAGSMAGWRLLPIAAGVMFANAGWAQSSATAASASDATNAAAPQLPPVVVQEKREAQTGTGPVSGYVATQSTAGTKTDTALIKTPQNISVVTRDQMDIQNVQSVAQALRYTSGINPEQRGTNTDSLEYLYARGFLVDEFWNGLRTPGPAGGFGYNVTSFDPYMFERIELLHGPASVLYGQGSPGGTVNLVSKMPTAEPLHEVGIQTGSYGRLQGFFDFSGPVDKDGKVLYRLTADGFNTGTQTDYVNQQRFAIAPSITWKPTKDTTFTLYANYQADPEAGIYNFVPVVGTIQTGVAQLPRSFYPGEPSFDSFRKTQESIGYQLDHRLNDVWSFKQSYRFLHNSETVQYVADDLGYINNGTALARETYMNSGRVNSHTVDNQATARFNTGPVAHQATVGIDYQNIQFDHVFLGDFGDTTPPLNITNPQYGQTIPYPTIMFATSNKQSIKQLGAYAQDQLDIGRWSLLLGLREDWTNEDAQSYKTGALTSQFNRAFTWRAGGVYQFESGIAPYASYSKSFQPQVGSSFSGQSFNPTTGEQYEVGVKFQPKGYNSFVTVSAFHLTQQNVLTTDPVNVNFQVQTGEVRSQGFEVEAHASLTNNLQLIASYTYTNLLNTKSNSSNLDKVPVGIPRNTASLWADYLMAAGPLAGLQLGAGVRYIGGSYGDTANSLLTSSATLIDLAVRYDLGRSVFNLHGWTASLNASNLLDRHYMASCSAGSCNWGQGRLVLAGLKYQW
ncbi:TonB-dependent siderophore receptor [Caballeronia sordidicola]|uniref:TonB-dependent siderophore receptor n=1 Tax=Caballeronia sordidicola TaxID=196367 RepID=A0A158HSX8_CABSO|nr:TonB-dependent siderophore receptor [Caballeronia sordidicola]SAL47484.1 TonB-dependent siderophore receptor [Caballeronia sordidicola]